MRFVLPLLLLVRIAHADVGVVVSGDPNMQARVLDLVQRWLQGKQQEIVAGPLGDADTSLIDCFVMEDMSCAKQVFTSKSKATNVVFVRVNVGAAGSRDYQIAAYWFTRGKDPTSDKRTCSNCDDDALQATLAELMTALLNKGAGGNAHLKISGGANLTVKIDGTEIGAGPVDRELPPGSHDLVFLHDGDPVDIRRIDLESGAVLELQAPRLGDRQSGYHGHSRLVPALLVAGGIAAAAVGGVFLYHGSLRGPDEPYIYTNATEIGLPLALAGAFAVGAGTSLFFAGSGSDAHVGVSGSF
jgi:hypothetical protein